MLSSSHLSESETLDDNDIGVSHSIDRFFSNIFDLPPMGDPGRSPVPVDHTVKPKSSCHDGHDWGSQSAAAAVKKLQSMGAQVFPPGSKTDIDWGVLAGILDAVVGHMF